MLSIWNSKGNVWGTTYFRLGIILPKDKKKQQKEKRKIGDVR